jgi:small-conductance mechanosensitive channel
MRYIILALKAVALVALVLIRLGEWDVSFLYQTYKYRQSLDYYVKVLANIAIFLLFLDFFQFFVIGWYRRRHKIRWNDNFIVGIGQIYSILLVIGIFVGFLSLFRIHPRELFTSLSIIFAGLAILTKDYISNLVTGMILTFSRQISIGDNVSIGTQRGKVMDITLQNVHLLNDDDDMIYIPNNTLLITEVVNYTKREIKRTSIDFEIDLKHLTNVQEMEQHLINVLKPFHDLIKPDSYYLRVAEVKRDYVLMKFQYILKQPDKEKERMIRRMTIRHLVEIISQREKFVHQIPDMPIGEEGLLGGA